MRVTVLDRVTGVPTRSRSDVVMSLQYLRGLAALMVVVTHAPEQIPAISSVFDTTFGRAGVDIFFVISGFIMSTITRRREQTPGPFLRSRLLRVVPLYWVFTTLAAAMLVLGIGAARHSVVTVEHFLLSILFIPHQSANAGGTVIPLLAPGWTLNFEMQFYLLFALAMAIDFPRREWICSALLLGLVVVHHAFALPAAPAFATGDINIEFIMGMGLAACHRRGLLDDLPPLLPALAILIGLGMIVGNADLFYLDKLPRSLLFGVPALLVAGGALGLERFCSQRHFLARIGDASYSIYLSHLFVLAGLRVVWLKLSLPTTGLPAALAFVAACLAVAIVAGFLVFRFVERPLLKGSQARLRS